MAHVANSAEENRFSPSKVQPYVPAERISGLTREKGRIAHRSRASIFDSFIDDTFKFLTWKLCQFEEEFIRQNGQYAFFKCCFRFQRTPRIDSRPQIGCRSFLRFFWKHARYQFVLWRATCVAFRSFLKDFVFLSILWVYNRRKVGNKTGWSQQAGRPGWPIP